METKTGEFTVKEAYGQVLNITGTYTHNVFASEDEALANGWTAASVLDCINAAEKSKARANEYQKLVQPYKPDPNDPSVVRETMLKGYVKLGIPREIAEKQIDALLAAK